MGEPTMSPCVHGHTSERYKDGSCKECRHASVRRWQAKNREKVDQITREWQAANRDRTNAATERWREKNPEMVKAQRARHYTKTRVKQIRDAREWRLKNPDRMREHSRRSIKKKRAENPEKYRNLVRLRRAKERVGIVSSDIVEQLMRKQDNRCVYCRVDLHSAVVRRELDHIMPLALDGIHEDANLQLLCGPCNRRKCAKHPDVFAAEVAAKRTNDGT